MNTYMSAPAKVADSTPSGIERRGFSRSPDRPTPAVMPVNAGKTMANTRMKGSARKPVGGGELTSTPDGVPPSAKNASETARMLATTHRALTPSRAPRVSIKASNATIPGNDTIRGSNPRPRLAARGPNDSAKAIM